MTINQESGELAASVEAILSTVGAPWALFSEGTLEVRSPIFGSTIGRVRPSTGAEVNASIEEAHAAFLAWRDEPAPKRGELVRLLGEELRAHKSALKPAKSSPKVSEKFKR